MNCNAGLIALINKIEGKRQELTEIALEKGINNKETIEISHELDKLIISYQKRKYKMVNEQLI